MRHLIIIFYSLLLLSGNAYAKEGTKMNITDYQEVEQALEDIFREGDLIKFKELELELGKENLHEYKFRLKDEPLIVRIFSFIGRSCSQEDEELVLYLIENGADINAGNDDNHTVFHAATYGDCFKVLDKLLELGVKTDIHSNYMKTPPSFYINSLEMYQFYKDHHLLSKSAENKNGETLIHKVIVNATHSPDFLSAVIKDFGVDNETKPGITPLMVAMRQLYYDENITKNIRFFLDNGGSLSHTDLEGNTVFYYAMRNPEIDDELISLLMSYNPDVTIENKRGDSPLFSSAARGLKWLKVISGEDKALLNKQSKYLKQSLMIIAVKYKQFDSVNYLFEKGLNVNQADITGKKPLDYALERDNQDIIDFLKEKGAVEASKEELESAAPKYKEALAQIKAIDDEAPLPRFVQDIQNLSKENIKKFLYQKGANEDPLFTYKYLTDILTYGTVDVLDYIESLGVDLSTKDSSGYTLIADAVFNKKIDFVKYLIEEKNFPAHETGKNGSSLIFVMQVPPEFYLYLKSKGAKFDDGYDPLDDCIYYKNLDLLKVLIADGFKLQPSVTNYDESIQKNIDDPNSLVIEYLLEHGLDKETTLTVKSKTYTLKQYAELVDNKKLLNTLNAMGAK